MSEKKRGGCRHRRVWKCSPSHCDGIKIRAPDYPGVVIEAFRIEFCEQCLRFRLIGMDKSSASPWMSPSRIKSAPVRAAKPRAVKLKPEEGVVPA